MARLHSVAANENSTMEIRIRALADIDFIMGVEGDYPTEEDLVNYLAESA